MKLATILVGIWLAVVTSIRANEVPRVPSTMELGGLKLKLTEAVRHEIQRDVNALHASRKYFDIKLDRVNLYFPIIEKIFKEENLPDDFKYLVIQESALISDAVSSANAVGYWQFKDFTGKEVGLRIDRQVDERLNIVTSTRGAAKYLKRHNFYFRNWIYSLMAYNTGRGGAQRYVNEKHFGASTMPINKNTHWYVKKFLAHKVAFEKEIGGPHSQGLRLEAWTKGGDKSLQKIAKEFDIEYSLLAQYNKWLLKGNVPSEREYFVMLPTYRKIKSSDLNAQRKKKNEEDEQAKIYGDFGETLDGKVTVMSVKLNGLKAIMATEEDNMQSMAKKAEMTVKKLAAFNEVDPKHKVVPGEFYYLRKKQKKANLYYYTAQKGESLWSISQKFGIRIERLAKYNRMAIIDDPEPGRVLWMRKRRPKDTPIEYRKPDQTPTPTTKPQQAGSTVRSEQIELNDPVGAQEVETEEEDISPAGERGVSKRNIHVVQPGETLYGISKVYDVGVTEIEEWNSLPNYVIKPGQELIINQRTPSSYLPPSPNTKKQEAPEVTIHEVQPGDTMYSISRKYDIAVELLMKLNNKENYNISVGEKLRVEE